MTSNGESPNFHGEERAPPPTLLDVFGVLAPPAGAHGVGEGVFGFLTTCNARALRLVSRMCRGDVAAARWLDAETRITGSLAMWRACFPGARAANVAKMRWHLKDADFVHLAGVKVLHMGGCIGITDAGLAHLTGIHTLDMSGCYNITGAGLAHLTGIHTLDINGCPWVTDACLTHLTGIHTLDMSWCTGITAAGLPHLSNIRQLTMFGCAPALIATARSLGLPVL